jgi:hypothetical protein
MKCSICYEKFFTPKTEEEFEKIYRENVKNNSYDEIMKFTNLLVTPKYNNTHSCSTPNCECLICEDCWIKITYNSKDIDEINEEEAYFFKCPYCRQIDWKNYMNNIFIELQKKVLEKEEFIEIMIKKFCS